mmetsp:Transcript_9032/g.14650  ORF Transcript_9032/g.14650 Transcript_9032/m.14650 type:complete len:135 (-) Transcript_9032:143-547(-)|eukprot:jgi/Bigna1/83838/fgenesh1_pg.116_\
MALQRGIGESSVDQLYPIPNYSPEFPIRHYAMLSMMMRELTPNDYELLSNLDSRRNLEERKQGLSEAEISVLPTNVITERKDAKVQNCCICLEDQVVGQLVRRLPCMHAFHRECIDRWLQEKSSCPICKKSARP